MGSDSDSDDGPPPDPDEPPPAVAAPKKEKKKAGESKEVQVSLRKVTDDKGLSLGGGLSAVRREMLMAIRAEEDEKWEDYEYCDGEVCFVSTQYYVCMLIGRRPWSLTQRSKTYYREMKRS